MHKGINCYRKSESRWLAVEETTVDPRSEQLFQDDEDFEGSGSTELRKCLKNKPRSPQVKRYRG